MLRSYSGVTCAIYRGVICFHYEMEVSEMSAEHLAVFCFIKHLETMNNYFKQNFTQYFARSWEIVTSAEATMVELFIFVCNSLSTCLRCIEKLHKEINTGVRCITESWLNGRFAFFVDILNIHKLTLSCNLQQTLKCGKVQFNLPLTYCPSDIWATPH